MRTDRLNTASLLKAWILLHLHSEQWFFVHGSKDWFRLILWLNEPSFEVEASVDLVFICAHDSWRERSRTEFQQTTAGLQTLQALLPGQCIISLYAWAKPFPGLWGLNHCTQPVAILWQSWGEKRPAMFYSPIRQTSVSNNDTLASKLTNLTIEKITEMLEVLQIIGCLIRF